MAPRTPQDRKPKAVGTTAKKVTSAQQWKKANEGIELEVPSGNVCLARRIDLPTLVTQGVIPNALMPMVNKAINTGEFDAEKELTDLDIEKITDMLSLYDHVALACVIQPELSPAPAEGEERDGDKLYVDEVDMDDKVFIFQWAVGGSSDLERFRAEQGAAMDALRSS